jgi:hypothetical protein
LSISAPSNHTQFSAAFTTNIAESNFRYTQLLPSGKSGWIPVAAARPLITNRLCYAKTPNGDWKIASIDQADQ